MPILTKGRTTKYIVVNVSISESERKGVQDGDETMSYGLETAALRKRQKVAYIFWMYASKRWFGCIQRRDGESLKSVEV